MRQRPPPYLQQQNNDNYEDMLLPSVYSTDMSVVEAKIHLFPTNNIIFIKQFWFSFPFIFPFFGYGRTRTFGLWPGLAIGSLLFVLILLCVLGNLLVILAILIERDLRSRPQYYLIFSLAVADLMVGLLITPLGAWTTLRQKWEMGVTVCDFWISVDVLVCTSSILHLVAIALDRYWSITNIYYTQNRTPQRIFTMLFVIWVFSLLISLAPQFKFLHLKDKGFVSRVENQKICLISQDIAYQVFSTSTAFYIPLCAIIIIYYKIMRAAKKRFRRERDRRTLNRGVVDDSSVPLKTSKQMDFEEQNSSPTTQKYTATSGEKNNNNYPTNCSPPILNKQQNGRQFSENNNKSIHETSPNNNINNNNNNNNPPEKTKKLYSNIASLDIEETEFKANENLKNGINNNKVEESKQQLINFPKHLKNIAEKGRKKRSGKKNLLRLEGKEKLGGRWLLLLEHSSVVGLLSLFFPSTVHSV
uniref:G-protein coupled receptors family 1 profile domain-containing protein n=1 Tax=Meloidogyne enterolobii TaxID=390850 RepID=A0A6V7WMJ5_MELEN|nr:unnamed protein product [Meloidogyne enterolobii]